MIARLSKAVMLAPIRLYRRFISPLFGPHCRFYPSCSQYCCEAIEAYGVWQGGYLSLKRCLKCHPWHPGGLDPVPPPQTKSVPNSISRDLTSE